MRGGSTPHGWVSGELHDGTKFYYPQDNPDETQLERPGLSDTEAAEDEVKAKETFVNKYLADYSENLYRGKELPGPVRGEVMDEAKKEFLRDKERRALSAKVKATEQFWENKKPTGGEPPSVEMMQKALGGDSEAQAAIEEIEPWREPGWVERLVAHKDKMRSRAWEWLSRAG